MNNIIVIETKEAYQDFKSFLNDPEVKIIEEVKKEKGKLYKFNTNEKIFVPNEIVSQEANEIDDLIFGKDKTPGLVNISIEDNILYKFYNDGTMKYEDYRPWVLTPRKYTFESKRLKGDQFYKYITPMDEIDYNQIGWNRDIWRPRRLEEGYLLQSGATYYKGMKLEDVSLVSFDIETAGLELNNTSKVFMISSVFRDNNGTFKKIFTVDKYKNDKEMILDWCKWVQKVNPNILLGFNIFSFDLEYLTHCYGSDLPLGREGRTLKFDEKPSKFRKDGSQQYEYYNAKLFGREIIDVFFLSIKYDISREFPSYGLKSIIKYLELEKKDRQHYDASQISKNWNNLKERKKIIQYGLDDADDTITLFDIMAPSFFYFTQSIPKTFQQINNEATGGQLDSFMIRAYLQDGYSQPKSSNAPSYEGAISMGIPGIYENVWKADIASLYPSIMLQYEIYDNQKDPNKKLLKALEYFRNERLKNKKLAKETGDKYYNDLQSSGKIAINSMYGFLSANFVLYNYPKGAEKVTKHGRDILLKGVEWATGYSLKKVIKKITNKGKTNEEIHYEWILGEKISDGNGYTLSNVDTDSFSASKDMTEFEFKEDLKKLNSIYPSLIKWEEDGFYEKVIILKAKNYILKSKDNVKLKGSSITDSKRELALREFTKEIITSLLININYNELKFIYNKYLNEVSNIEDINRWTIKKTITKAILEGERKNETKVKNALEGQILQEGNKVWLYNAIDGETQVIEKGEPKFYKKTGLPKMVLNKVLKTPDKWNHDEDKLHYIKRIHDTLQILSNVIDIKKII